MSANNGVIRIGRKGIKKFAFGEDGDPFDVDVVVAFQQWITIDDSFREESEDRSIKTADMAQYHGEAVNFAQQLSGCIVTTAEALDFIARLREEYDKLADFFRPRLQVEQDSPDSLEAELRFSAEEF